MTKNSNKVRIVTDNYMILKVHCYRKQAFIKAIAKDTGNIYWFVGFMPGFDTKKEIKNIVSGMPAIPNATLKEMTANNMPTSDEDGWIEL